MILSLTIDFSFAKRPAVVFEHQTGMNVESFPGWPEPVRDVLPQWRFVCRRQVRCGLRHEPRRS